MPGMESQQRRPLHVGINAHLMSGEAGYRSAGIHGYIANLLAHLPDADPDIRYTVFTGEAPDNRDNYILAQTPQPSISLVKDEAEFIEVLASGGPPRRQAMLPPLQGRPLLSVVNFLREKGIPFQIITNRGINITGRSEFEMRRYEVDWVSDDANWFFYVDSPPTIILHVKEARR